MTTCAWGDSQPSLQREQPPTVPPAAARVGPVPQDPPTVAAPVVPATPRLHRPARAITVSSTALVVTLWLGDLLMLAASPPAVDRPVVTAALTGVVAVLGCIALAAAWVSTSTWLYRAVAAARIVSPRRMRHRPWLAWAAWVLPVVSLFLPPVLVRDAWVVGARGRPRFRRPDVGAWWTLSLAGCLAHGLPLLLARTAWARSPLWVALTVLGLVLWTLALREWLRVVAGLTRAWETRRGMPTAPPPPPPAWMARYAQRPPGRTPRRPGDVARPAG